MSAVAAFFLKIPTNLLSSIWLSAGLDHNINWHFLALFGSSFVCFRLNEFVKCKKNIDMKANFELHNVLWHMFKNTNTILHHPGAFRMVIIRYSCMQTAGWGNKYRISAIELAWTLLEFFFHRWILMEKISA